MPGLELYWMRAWDEREPLFVYMAVIQGDRTMIVNTGAPIDLLNELNEHWRSFAGESAMLQVHEEDDSRRALRAIAVRADVSKAAEVRRMVTGAVQRFGRIDILVNNAGICPFHEFLDIIVVR